MNPEFDLSGIDNKNLNADTLVTDDEPEPIAELNPQPQDQEQDPDDPKEVARRRLVLKLYVNEFADTEGPLRAYKKTNINNMSLAELASLKTDFDQLLGTLDTVDSGKEMIFGAINLYEVLCTQFAGIKCKGITEILVNDAAFVRDVKHCVLSNIDQIYSVRPEMRVGFKLMSTTVKLHKLRQYQELTTQPQPQQQPIIQQPAILPTTNNIIPIAF